MKKFALLAAVAFVGFSAPAQAVELVTNGGFETGDLTGWIQGGNTGFTGVSSTTVHSGNFAAFLGPEGSPGTLTQMLNTVAGQSYNISFWLQNDGGTPNSFQAFFGGNPILLNLNDSGAFDYFNFTFTATGDAPTALEFVFQQDPAFWHLDDVSVIGDAGPALPEPGTWMTMLLGFGVLGMAMRFRRRRKPLAAFS
ncbi:MAG TPA: carbohydrate binding domain-containing protein [Sphingomicrobium sp.]|nr:carbohydrate binding domain-containing protein [Sphingomicrobium sp.]